MNVYLYLTYGDAIVSRKIPGFAKELSVMFHGILPTYRACHLSDLEDAYLQGIDCE